MLMQDIILGTIDHKELQINKSELEARIGKNIDIADYISLINTFNDAAIYKFAYVRVAVKIENSSCIFDNNISVKSTSLSKVLNGCKEAVFFIVSAGVSTDRLILKAGIESQLKAFLLDAVGSSMIEACADRVNDIITENLRCTKRFSPGYSDFPLEFQSVILNRLKGQATVGVSLSENLLMTPMKSISAVIGIY